MQILQICVWIIIWSQGLDPACGSVVLLLNCSLSNVACKYLKYCTYCKSICDQFVLQGVDPVVSSANATCCVSHCRLELKPSVGELFNLCFLSLGCSIYAWNLVGFSFEQTCFSNPNALKKVGTVATVEDFWQLHQLIKPPSCLALANDYAMFRQVYSSNFICLVLCKFALTVNDNREWIPTGTTLQTLVVAGDWCFTFPRLGRHLLDPTLGGWRRGREGMSWTLLGSLCSIFCLEITWASKLRYCHFSHRWWYKNPFWKAKITGMTCLARWGVWWPADERKETGCLCGLEMQGGLGLLSMLVGW